MAKVFRRRCNRVRAPCLGLVLGLTIR
jgi:hypothetical protein